MHQWIYGNEELEFGIIRAGEQDQQLWPLLEGAAVNWMIKCGGASEVNHKCI